jgi:hypothetical protein
MGAHKTTTVRDQVGTAAWENEGGAIKPRSTTDLPEGVTLVLSNEYWVGQYRYTNLDDALAEHRRQSGK